MPEGSPGALAIVAGRGDLPRLIAEDRRDRGLPYLLVTFPGTEAAWMDEHPRQRHRFEKVGALFRALRGAGVADVVFAGGMDRPALRLWQADAKAVTVAARVLWLLRQGDDAMLRGLGAIFEGEGFRLLGAADCLPGLTVEPGVLGRHRPAEADRADARRGAAVLAALGPLDVAQAAVVARGVCLGIEAIEGTDALLARVADLPGSKRAHCPPPSGVLVKLPKPGQDRRVDLPTIGPATLEGAKAAGLAGVCIEAGGANILDRPATVAAADAAGLFLWSAERAEIAP